MLAQLVEDSLRGVSVGGADQALVVVIHSPGTKLIC